MPKDTQKVYRVQVTLDIYGTTNKVAAREFLDECLDEGIDGLFLIKVGQITLAPTKEPS